MMKKRVLMPLLVASMMVASVVSLNSCKKDQEQQEKASLENVRTSFNDVNAPFVETVYRTDKEGTYKVCPYCGDTLRPNVYQHWHAFGTPPADFDYSLFYGPNVPHPELEPFGVADCLNGLDDACPYSGIAAHDPWMIQFYMEHFGVDSLVADAMTLDRFHGHNISYVIGSNPEQGGSGYHNDWHVGGGVPFWPVFGSGTGPH